MTIKEKLQSYKITKRAILNEQDKILEYKAKCEAITRRYEEKNSGNLCRKDDRYVTFVEQKERCEKFIKRHKERLLEVENLVDKCNDVVLEEVLKLRYIKGYSWVKIEMYMNMSKSSVHRYHKKALDMLINLCPLA